MNRPVPLRFALTDDLQVDFVSRFGLPREITLELEFLLPDGTKRSVKLAARNVEESVHMEPAQPSELAAGEAYNRMLDEFESRL